MRRCAVKGRHHVVIETSRLKYEFDIKRNITVIQGDSATGKTTLVALISDYAEHGNKTGVILQSDVNCLVYATSIGLWENAISDCEDTIIFIDEGHDFIYTKKFASVIKNTSNYYVLITRKPLINLPYSIKEIYGIRNSGKYNFPQKIYHEFYPIYNVDESGYEDKCKILVVEDSCAGLQFFKAALDGVECLSADGNSNVYRCVREIPVDKRICIVADGAAFGAFIDKIMYLQKDRNIAMYFPESFEWMILKSGVVNISNLNDILQNTERYVDSKQYFSWERFYTELLEANTQGTVFEYHKNKLSDFYLEGKNKEKILNVAPKEFIDLR